MSDTERVGRVRKGRRDGGFTVVSNDLINHRTLSVEARALMIYLLSRPEDWVLRVSDVRRFLGHSGKVCGRNKAYEVVAELKALNYIVMCEDLDGKHFAGVTYYIFDNPVADPDEIRRLHEAGGDPINAPSAPLPEKRDTDALPLPLFRDPIKGDAVINKDIYKTLNPPSPPKRQTTRRRGFGEGSERIDQQPIADPWSVEWIEFRTQILKRGRECAPAAPTKFIRGLIEKGGDAGERARLDHAAASCYPTVKAMDTAAKDQARGWRIQAELADAAADLAAEYHSVAVDGPELQAWQDAHRRRGWPLLPIPERAMRLWLPKAGVAALDLVNDHPDDRRTGASANG